MFTFLTLTTLKNRFFYPFLIVSLITLISGCSTKKNTWASRTYQDVNTRFNVYFNGTTSYNSGLKSILASNQEDYSSIIPMYPISRHKNAESATTDMDQTIEKCRKAIKLHSIKVKPVRNSKKANLPEYKLYYNQKEFNPALKEVWLQLGKAEFHKADFLGAVGSFAYISRFYSEDKDMTAKCQLWMVRAYAEMGWIYEAEQVLSKIVQDDLKHTSIGLFASVNADLLLKKNQYKEAIPFLELALSKEKEKAYKLRFMYLLAQLYHKTNDDKSALLTYSKVIKKQPPFEMDFNARISSTQLSNQNVTSVRKDLKEMLRNRNNKEYLDQIYFVLGNTYLQESDTVKALENYKLSVEKSTRNGIDKAVTLITLGDMYYLKKKYVQAQPCFDEASKIISNEHNDYPRVTRLAEMLGELVTQKEIVLLQDSLQQLAALPESKRIEVVNKLIDKIYADEKLAEENAIKDREKQIRAETEELENSSPIGMSQGERGGWYFYNADLMRTGQAEFVKKWGRRKLEDNWRRMNKTTTLFAEEPPTTVIPTTPKDSTAGEQEEQEEKKEEISDNKKPEFYLRQIPVTPIQIIKSDAEIATALFSMGLIYKDKIEDYPMAISTFDEFIRRFAKDGRVPDAYFNIYIIHNKLNNESEANLYRTKLIQEFPNSKYYNILSQPNYAELYEKMELEQDSIYNLTYTAYNKSDFPTVFKQVEYIQKNYPLSTLMPKFLFLNALSIGKNESPEKFRMALDSLITHYPESDVSAMSKDILALIKQGQEAKTGTSSGTLLTRREEIVKTQINEISQQEFSTEKQTKHRLMLIGSVTEPNFNKLMYNLASFNFSRFMIKDFDLISNKLDSTQNVLSVTNFESYDEAQWYLNSINSDDLLTKLLNDLIDKLVIISEENYALLKTTFSLDEYLAFQMKKFGIKQSHPIANNKLTKKKVDETVEKENKPKINMPEATLEVKQEKPIDTAIKKPVEKEVEKVKTTTESKEQPKPKVQPTPTIIPIEPAIDDEPLYKGLFAYKANEPHFVAIYIVSGTINFERTKTAIEAYNKQNYAVLNLNVSLETFEKQQIIIIGSLADAQVGKSYLLRMVKESTLFDGLKGSVYRNLLGSQKNLNTLMQNNALGTYFEFMQEYYLK